jgi:hypothetical protein
LLLLQLLQTFTCSALQTTAQRRTVTVDIEQRRILLREMELQRICAAVSVTSGFVVDCILMNV